MPIDQFNIKTEKGVIDIHDRDLPQIESYEEFKQILKKTDTNETKYTPVNNLNDLTIIQSASNNNNSPDTNIYAIQKTEQTTNGTVEVQLWYVVGKSNIENWLSQYSETEIYDLKQEIQMQIDENEVIVSSQAALNSLQDMIMWFDPTDPESVKDFFKNAESLSKDVRKDYDASLKAIQKELKTRLNKNDKPTILEKNMLLLLKHKADTDITNIKGIEIKLQNLKRDYKKETNVDAFQANAHNLYMKLGKYRQQADALSQVLYSEQSLNNFTQNPPLNMDIPTRSGSEAELTRDVYQNMLGENIAINLFLLEADGKKIKNDQNETLHDYMSAVMTGQKDGSKEKFIPSVAFKSEAIKVINLYPELASYIDVSAMTNKDQKFDWFWGWSFGWWWAWAEYILNKDPEYIINNGARRSWWLLDKLTPSPLTDLIDKQNIEPQTKERLKTLSWLAFLVWAGVLAWKTVSNARKAAKWDKEAERWWIAAGAALFGWAYISSGNIFNFKSLWNDVADRFSSDSDNIEWNKKNPTLEQEVMSWITGMNIIFAGMTWLQIDAMLTPEDNNGVRKMDYDKAKTLIEASNASNKSTRLQMIETLRNSSNQNLVPIALSAFWLSSEKLKNNPDKKYDERAETWLKNLANLIVDMKKNNYARWNPEMKDEIYKYMSGQSDANFEKLANMWAFEKDEVLKENPDLKTNIDALTILTSQSEKDTLYKEALKVYEELTSSPINYAWEFNFIEEGGVLYLETYGKQTAINLTSKSMWGMALYTRYQTLKAANLTNRIQDIFAGKSKVSQPFNISATGDIEFEKTSTTSTDGWKNPRQFVKDKIDTEVIDAGRRWTLASIAPSLEDQKKKYVDFLNAMPIRKA